MKSRGLASLGHRTRDINLRHTFAIGPLCGTYLFNRQARLYYCTRCTWSFLVAGSLAAVVDAEGRPLAGEEADQRFRSFANGPCPVLVGLAREVSLAQAGHELPPHFASHHSPGGATITRAFRAWWRNSGWHPA